MRPEAAEVFPPHLEEERSWKAVGQRGERAMLAESSYIQLPLLPPQRSLTLSTSLSSRTDDAGRSDDHCGQNLERQSRCAHGE